MPTKFELRSRGSQCRCPRGSSGIPRTQRRSFAASPAHRRHIRRHTRRDSSEDRERLQTTRGGLCGAAELIRWPRRCVTMPKQFGEHCGDLQATGVPILSVPLLSALSLSAHAAGPACCLRRALPRAAVCPAKRPLLACDHARRQPAAPVAAPRGGDRHLVARWRHPDRRVRLRVPLRNRRRAGRGVLRDVPLRPRRLQGRSAGGRSRSGLQAAVAALTFLNVAQTAVTIAWQYTSLIANYSDIRACASAGSTDAAETAFLDVTFLMSALWLFLSTTASIVQVFCARRQAHTELTRADAYRVFVLLQRTLFAKVAVSIILFASLVGFGSGWAVAILNAKIGNGPPGTPIAQSPIVEIDWLFSLSCASHAERRAHFADACPIAADVRAFQRTAFSHAR